MSVKHQKYSPEFREEAARMVVEGSRAIAQVAREYGLSETTLGNWVRAYRETGSSDLSMGVKRGLGVLIRR